MKRSIVTAILVCSGLLTLQCSANNVESTYQVQCASCHGENLQGAMAASLVDGVWAHGSSVDDITHNIAKGIPEKGMPAWEGTLTAEQIRSLVIFIQEREAASQPAQKLDRTATFKTELHNFTLEKVGQGDDVLWSIDFLPNGDIISAQKNGKLWLFNAKGERTEITGLPKVWTGGQAGLLEAAVHPDYKKNGWIYLAYSRSDDGSKGMTSIVRGKIKSNRWSDQQDIFKAEDKYLIATQYHFGSRIVFKDGYLFFSIGDRGRQDMAQDISVPNGKVHRIHDDGKIPKDNPFVKKGYATIYSYGNRNPQGLALHPVTGELWEAEHGPRGGDEINHIEKGNNYGWPVITYGMNYNGTPMTALTAKAGMEQPKHYWVPSIAVSGIEFYSGNVFPKWQNQLLVASLAKEELHRIEIKDNAVVKDEILLKGLGRIRDVGVSSAGDIYISLNRGAGEIFKLVPVK